MSTTTIPPTPTPTTPSNRPQGWFWTVLYGCAALMVVSLTLMLIFGMSGCLRSASGGFQPSQAWNVNTPPALGSKAAPTPTLKMPSNFEQVSKPTAPHVEKVFSAVRESWPAAAKARFAEGFNPVAGRIPGTTKAWYYHDPSAFWNPDPNYPPGLLPVAQSVHVGNN